MNTKIALGLGGIIIVLGVGYYALRPAAPALAPGSAEVPSATTSTAVVPTTATSTPPQTVKDRSKPTFTIGPTTVVAPSAAFDVASLTSSSAYPVITGSATVSKVGMIIYNSENVGIIGTSDISVTQGRWSYPCSIPLEPGTYTLKLFFGTASQTATLTVTSSS